MQSVKCSTILRGLGACRVDLGGSHDEAYSVLSQRAAPPKRRRGNTSDSTCLSILRP